MAIKVCSSVQPSRHWALKIADILCGVMLLCASEAWARDVFLNGTDISSAKNQKLKNVNVQIDGHGNVYIEAKHYQIHDESAYLPLSNYLQGGAAQPQNTAPLTLPAHNGKPITVHPGGAASGSAKTALNFEKPGSKVPPQGERPDAETPADDSPPETNGSSDGEAVAP